MSKARSLDLRERVVAAVASGMSRRQAAARYSVSVSSAIRWDQLKRETGEIAPKPRGGHRRSPLEVATRNLTKPLTFFRIRDRYGFRCISPAERGSWTASDLWF
jgi:transposase